MVAYSPEMPNLVYTSSFKMRKAMDSKQTRANNLLGPKSQMPGVSDVFEDEQINRSTFRCNGTARNRKAHLVLPQK